MKSLTPERWQQIKLVLYDALELPPQRRPEFLAKACSSDVSLLKEVESLLSLGDDEARTSFLESTRRRVTLPAGTKLRDYEVQSLLGVGGMGEVYRAHDPRLGRDVAIKVLPSIFASDPDRLRRFEQEARAAAALNHPNILAIFDIGATGEETPYVVSELLEGETLRECVRRGPLPVGKTIDLALQLTSGLAAAHEKGIIHRDLKPENLFLTTDGRLKILDFGLAKLERRPASSPVDALTLSQETGAGVVLGTAGYMSPEQVRGLAVDQRSDIFAVGAIVYEMLSGIRAFHGDTAADTMNAILSRDAPPLSEVNSTIPPALERIVRRCLEKNPNERFHSIRDVAFALEAISDPVSQTREGQPDRLRRRLRGDLDNIVLKALQKKPQRRYDSVAEFSQDIDRHLQHLPVKARPSTLVYSVSKFVQRHKTEVSASVIVLLMTATLGLVVGGMFWKLRLGQKSTEKDRAVLGDRATAQPTVAERRLTANPDDARVTSSAISPDGKYLAFTDKTGFYLRQVDGGETHAVPLPKGFDALAESWFPDSIHLVVSWVEDPKEPPSLWEISVMGGTPRKLADAGASARVSPDGSKIAFLSGIYGAEIWLMRADGGEAKRIVGDAETEAHDTFSPVAWAPDGRGLAYVRTTTISWSEVTKIEIADIASGQTEVVLSKRGLGPALTWTGAWRMIYSLQEPPPNQNDFNLWCVQLDARSARPLGTSTRVTSDRGRAAEVSVSNDGKLLALRRWTPQSDVYVAELEAGGKRLGTPHRLTLDERQDAPFSWTPDSKAVLFASDRDGPWHIFKQAIDQTQPELLVGGNDHSIMPRLTPDGSALLYLVVPKPGDSSHNFQIMRVPLNGGASQFVLQAPGIWNQQCARLPSTLCIYSSRGPNQNFFSFDPLNGTARVLTTIEGGPFFWSLSPDGKDLAVVKEGGQTNPGIQILSISDNSKRTIPVPGWAVIRNVDWSADGKSLWVSALNTRSGWHFEWFLETFALLNIDLDGRVTARLPKGDVSFLWAVPSPDGRRLALYGATYSSNVWLLENF